MACTSVPIYDDGWVAQHQSGDDADLNYLDAEGVVVPEKVVFDGISEVDDAIRLHGSCDQRA